MKIETIPISAGGQVQDPSPQDRPLPWLLPPPGAASIHRFTNFSAN